jgi:hypothetical protein
MSVKILFGCWLATAGPPSTGSLERPMRASDSITTGQARLPLDHQLSGFFALGIQ